MVDRSSPDSDRPKTVAERIAMDAAYETLPEPRSSAGIEQLERSTVTYEACKEAAEIAHEKTAMLRRVMEAKDPLHPETRRLVHGFADALAEKLIKAQQKYGRKDDWRINDWEDDCRAELMRHIEKGDPLDVAAYCAFMWRRGWSTKPSLALAQPVPEPEVIRLQKAMETAKVLIGAINDRATPAVRESNINMAWHILDDNLKASSTSSTDRQNMVASDPSPEKIDPKPEPLL